MYNPLGKDMALLFEQTWIPFTQGYFVPCSVEIGPEVLEKKIFKISSMHFRYFQLIYPLENGIELYLNKP